MKIWLVSFLILFVLVEFYQWFQSLKVPLPFMLVAGAVLAIASNLLGSRWKPFDTPQDSGPPPEETADSDPFA